jgi:hypothetical protein
MRTRILALLFLVAACKSTNPAGDGGASADLAGANPGSSDLAGQDVHPADLAGVSVDLAGGGDGAVSCNVSTSPSGYECDPWSVHLYTAKFVSASATTLRLVLDHDPNNEGSASDTDWPAEHDFRQLLTVDFPIDDALRGFLCIVFADATPPTAYSVGASLYNLNHYGYSILDTEGGTPRWQNVSDLCRVTSLPVVVWPNRVTSLPDVAVMIPRQPDPHLLTVGAPVAGWLARGLLGNDEERELAPVIQGTVAKVSTHACSDPAGEGC